MCIYNRLIPNPKYTENSKNKGIVPKPTDRRALVIPVGCGQCIECRKKKARDWCMRLKETIRHEPDKLFVTLTFSNESITSLYNDKTINNLTGYELDNAAAKLGVRRFLERWRKEHGKSIRHWFITELGHQGTENIHLHGIIFTKDKEKVAKHWKYGFMYAGKYVSERTINYMTKYMLKIDTKHRGYKQRIYASAGLGAEYLTTARAITNKYNGINTRETYQDYTGHKIALPQYIRNKMYTDQQREEMWMAKLDKQERYVLGQKINISTTKGQEDYRRALRAAQMQNKALGYGNGNHNWTLSNYEKERREYLQKKRQIKTELQQWEDVMNGKYDTGHPTSADRSTRVTLSRYQQYPAGVLPTITDRSDLGAPDFEEERKQRIKQQDVKTMWKKFTEKYNM